MMANEQIAAQLDSGDHEGFWLSVIDRGKIHWGMFWFYLRVAVADYSLLNGTAWVRQHTSSTLHGLDSTRPVMMDI